MTSKIKYLIAHAVSFSANFCVVLLLARLLGVAEFGRYGVWLAVMNFLVPIATFGMTPYIIRTIKSGRYQYYSFYKSVKYLFLLGAVSTVAFLFLVAAFIPGMGVLSWAGLSFIFMVISSAGLVVMSAFSRAKEEPGRYLLNVGGQKILLLIIIAAFALSSGSFSVESYFACSALAFAIILALLLMNNTFPHNEKGGAKLPNALRFCVPVILTNCLILALPLIERAVLVRWVELSELGRYVFNFELVAKLNASLLLLMKVMVFPSIMGADKKVELLRYRAFLKNIVIACALAAAALVLFSKTAYSWTLTFIGMREFSDSLIFVIAVGYSLIMLVGYMVSIGVMITGRTKVMTYSALLMGAAYPVLLFVFVPAFGVYGAGFALLFSQLLYLICLYILCERELVRYVENSSN